MRTVLLLLATCSTVHAFDSEKYMNVDPNISKWFKAQKSPQGVPCCDVADGHRTDYDQRADNHYYVPINGEWYQVPTEAVIYNSGNPVGEAVVWFVDQGETPLGPHKRSIYIRCFIPSDGV